MISIDGLIVRARYQRGKTEYTITDGETEVHFYTDATLPVGTAAHVEGEMAVGGIVASRAEALAAEKSEAAYSRVRERMRSKMKFPEGPVLSRDAVSAALWPAIRGAASEIMCAKKLNRPVLLRFHGDADGICGAFAISSVIGGKAFQQNSAIYSVRDALRDMAFIGQEGRPLFILVDFGSADGCRDAFELLRAGGIDRIVIDHHPGGLKNEPGFVNPLSVEGGSSGHTAGYVACEVAAACGLDCAKALSLAKIACAGDKSQLLGSREEDVRKAMVLDFLASHVSYGNNLDFYRKVMDKEELFVSIAKQADETIGEAAEKAMARAKTSAAGPLRISVFSLEGIAMRGEWPPSSKITTRVFDKLKEGPEGGGLLAIGYTDRSVIIRLDDNAAALGLDANGLAGMMKASMPDFIEGGGGHAKAGALRVREGFVKDAVNELVRTANSIVAKG